MRSTTSAAGKTTSIRVNTRLLDEAVRQLGAKSRTEAARIALEEIVRMHRFRKIVKKYTGKGGFANSDE